LLLSGKEGSGIEVEEEEEENDNEGKWKLFSSKSWSNLLLFILLSISKEKIIEDDDKGELLKLNKKKLFCLYQSQKNKFTNCSVFFLHH
jgi:hypothetical protein